MRIKSNVFRMYEMKGMIEDAIKNIDKVIAEQEEMHSILSKAKRKVISDVTLEGIKRQTEQLRQRKAQYQFDLQIVTDVVQRYEEHKDKADANEIDILITEVLHLVSNIKIEEDKDEPAENNATDKVS